MSFRTQTTYFEAFLMYVRMCSVKCLLYTKEYMYDIRTYMHVVLMESSLGGCQQCEGIADEVYS